MNALRFTVFLLACLLLASVASPLPRPPASAPALAHARLAAFTPAIAPGNGPLVAADEATALAYLVALGSLAQGASPAEILHLDTIAASYAVLQASGSPGQASGALWAVSFSGRFSPKRSFPGLETPIYSRLTVYVDQGSRGVVGVSMRSAVVEIPG